MQTVLAGEKPRHHVEVIDGQDLDEASPLWAIQDPPGTGKPRQPGPIPGAGAWILGAYPSPGSSKHWPTWEHIFAMAARRLPQPRVLHPYPVQRFAATHPK